MTIYIEDLHEVQIDNREIGLSIQYGTNTISFSTSNLQIVGYNPDKQKFEFVINGDDFELYQGIRGQEVLGETIELSDTIELEGSEEL